MKIFFVLLTLCLSSTVFCADPTWTILVYGDADNNLSPQLVEDIKKMERVGSSASFRIVVEADFDASNEEENCDAGLPEDLLPGTTRFLVDKSTDPDKLTSKPAQRLRELNHDDPQVMKDFLLWGMRNYPADRYGVIFWDHGGQWEGFGGDEQDGTLDHGEGIGTARIKDVLASVLRERSVGKFDFIAFDTCLMGGLEVLEDFEGLTDTFFACPEIDYGDGWNYEKSLGWLKANSSAQMKDFALKETEFWGKLHMSEENEGDRVLAAHCAYDLTQYSKVRAAFKDFTSSLSKEISPGNLSIPKHRRTTVEYSLSLTDESSATDFIDLGQFARAFAEDSHSSPELKSKSKALADAIDSMVISKVLGDEKYAASGLSIWYPVKRAAAAYEDEDDAEIDAEIAKDKFNNYKRLNLFKNSRWAEYIQSVWACREEFDDEPILSVPESASIVASAAKGLVLPVDVESGRGAFLLHGSLVDNMLGGNGDEFVYLGQVIRSEIDGSGSYSLTWNMKTLSVVDAKGAKAFLGAFPRDVAGRLWVSCAQYRRTADAKPFNVFLLVQVKDGEARFLKMLDGESDDLAPAPLTPHPGGTLMPMYLMETRRGNNPDKWRQDFFPSGMKLTIPKEGLAGMKVEMAPLKPGSYILELAAEDINGSFSNIVEYDLTVTP
jgi:hypothetical protein